MLESADTNSDDTAKCPGLLGGSDDLLEQVRNDWPGQGGEGIVQ